MYSACWTKVVKNTIANTATINKATKMYEDIKSLINVNHNLGRVDVAHLLVKRGYAKNIPEVFEKYLVSAYEKVRTINKGLTYEECINLILSSGGIPVLAHPKTLKLNEKE